ncbi:MAG: FAD-dependent oxidoreductase [Ardenticatenaceae bacterium]|nr:FAD-dependent oxidoreductase [Anaerolineales bacterium]MCB8937358.1 FAD-dependent oxidoreductase [Ardenticatenaceae bacterium]MCB8975447.1 FAD-dependent oxidoreductase [Ardenticatenaceae bacterium]
MSDAVIDVAIVGGGVSGVYTGWRLLTADLSHSRLTSDKPLNVQLFELSDRIGGRLVSLDPPEMPGIKAEFGGMRYLTNQPLVAGLVEQLGLATRPFPVSGPENIYYVRGQHLRQAEFANPDKVPYRVRWQERGKTPGQLIMEAIDVLIPGATKLTPAQWLDVKANYKFNGRFLWELGFWNLLHQVMSSEAYKLVMDAGGYNTTMTNWNAAEAIPWYLSDFGPEAQYRTVIDGMESVPRTVAERFVAAGGQIHFGSRLNTFSRREDGLIELQIDGRSPLLARHLVLAMPRRSLELLDDDTQFLLHPDVKPLIPTVTPHPMFKLFLCYRYAWWQDAGVNNGRSVTDLPVRQVYYFGSEADGPAVFNPELRDSLVMASYDDGPFVGFWTGLAEQGHSTTHCFPPSDEPRWNRYACPPAMVAHAQRQLQLVHDLEYIPEPYAAGFQDWGQDPFGGAWNSWNIHVKAWEVQEKMVQPLADTAVYIIGEAYSGSQGWIEGALETAEALLQQKWGVKRG